MFTLLKSSIWKENCYYKFGKSRTNLKANASRNERPWTLSAIDFSRMKKFHIIWKKILTSCQFPQNFRSKHLFSQIQFIHASRSRTEISKFNHFLWRKNIVLTSLNIFLHKTTLKFRNFIKFSCCGREKNTSLCRKALKFLFSDSIFSFGIRRLNEK